MMPPTTRLPCEGKQAFATKGMAMRIFARKAANHGFRNNVRSKSHVYRCPNCRAFHIGSQPRSLTPRNLST